MSFVEKCLQDSNFHHDSIQQCQGTSAVVRVIEQCCFNSVPDPFNGQTVNFILKPPKVIESRTYVKKANLKHY